ncbi:MAG: nucleotidyltransferase domain-containing protein [Rhodocyclaceae bacterium]|nr:nucleotidyltransferase domain-containing protein [Rhodocyclaceae bacterium]
MRLTEFQRCVIKEEVARVMGDDVNVLLFGSRIDDSRRGGDIDLYIETPEWRRSGWRQVLRLNAALQERLGEQKLDIILHQAGEPLKPIHVQARRHGVRL